MPRFHWWLSPPHWDGPLANRCRAALLLDHLPDPRFELLDFLAVPFPK
jgi:hypothetical protein